MAGFRASVIRRCHLTYGRPSHCQKVGQRKTGQRRTGPLTYLTLSTNFLRKNPLYELKDTTHLLRKMRPVLRKMILKDRAFEAPNLLGSTVDDELAENAALLDSAPPKKVAAIAALVSDAKLASYIRTATANRVSAEILMPAGLYAVRWLAATMLADDPEDDNDDGPTPAEALDVVLDAMRARVGWQPGAWLNSLALRQAHGRGSIRGEQNRDFCQALTTWRAVCAGGHQGTRAPRDKGQERGNARCRSGNFPCSNRWVTSAAARTSASDNSSITSTHRT